MVLSAACLEVVAMGWWRFLHPMLFAGRFSGVTTAMCRRKHVFFSQFEKTVAVRFAFWLRLLLVFPWFLDPQVSPVEVFGCLWMV